MEKQEDYLSLALDRIFLNTSEIGFWDEKNSRIHSRLNFTENWEWTVDPDMSDRYGVFTIMMILLAKYNEGLDISKYESKIISYLKYIGTNISNYEKSNVTYGAFNALVLGQLLYGDKVSFNAELKQSFNFVKEKIKSISNNEDSLMLIGLSLYYKYIDKSNEVFSYIEEIVKSLLKTQNKNGFFLTGDIRAVYHQRTMYTLWGLAFASQITYKDEIKKSIEKTIEYVWSNRKDGKDNAFLWHPLIFNIRAKSKIPLPIISAKSVDYLFECHQTFFANAVSFYQYFYKTEKYTNYRQKAMKWIFGENRINENLVTITNIGIPTRIMSRKGKIFIKNNEFKGSYEVGSYIYALAIKDV